MAAIGSRSTSILLADVHRPNRASPPCRNCDVKKKKQRPNNFHLFAPFSALRWPRENHRRRPFNSATKKKKEKFFFSSSKMAFYQLIGCIQFFVSKNSRWKVGRIFHVSGARPDESNNFPPTNRRHIPQNTPDAPPNPTPQ